MIRNWHHKDGLNAGEHEAFAKNVAKWIEHGQTHLELCFVMVKSDEIIGGIAFSADESEQASILDFSISHDSFRFGAELIVQSIEATSFRSVCYHLYNDSEQYSRYRQCFIDAGLVVAQEKLSYRFTGELLGYSETEITYRSYKEVGDEAFINAIRIVTQRTLDRADLRSVLLNGESKAAEILISDLKELDFQPEIWMLAYSNDSFVGLVIPTNFGDAYDGKYGALNYIGVTPSERGKGYVDILLMKGTQLLISQGVTTIIADIDVLNHPMKHALERNGYIFDCEEVVLEKLY